MDRIARLFRGPRSRVAAVIGGVAVVLIVGIATATILTPDPIGAPPTASPTTNWSRSAPAAPTASPLSPVPTPSAAPPTPEPTPTPSAHTVTAGVIQAVVADVRVRESANVDATVVATLSSGQQARTTASIVVADGYTWTDVELQPSGIRGWAAIADRGGTDPWLVTVKD